MQQTTTYPAVHLAPTPSGLPARVFVRHHFPEKQVNLGEVTMNYAEAGDARQPALLLLPGQAESWWGYEETMKLLADQFHVFAVDLRGQGRSTWTPGRYTFDNLGNDLVRFIARVIGRPVIVSGNSSGGVLAAWLSAYALPGQVRGALLEDPPLFSGEPTPLYGPSIRQSSGPILELFREHIGKQWQIGDWSGFIAAAKASVSPLAQLMGTFAETPQNFREFDPEWCSAFLDGTMWAGCPSERLLTQVKTPILLTHHAHTIDPGTGNLIGALSALQAEKASELIKATGVAFAYASFADAAHAMHTMAPPRFASALRQWAATLPPLGQVTA